MSKTKAFTLIKPDDWHLHLRDGQLTKVIVNHTADQFQRAIIMPNLLPPVTTVSMAEDYRHRILSLLPDESQFQPLMTLYLTDNTSVKEIEKAASSPFVHGIKMYPAGATTNSEAGVSHIDKVLAALDAMQSNKLPLLVHGEVTRSDIDVFDREAVFIEEVLKPLTEKLPALKIVLEHITTAQGIEFVKQSDDNIAGNYRASFIVKSK